MLFVLNIFQIRFLCAGTLPTFPPSDQSQTGLVAEIIVACIVAALIILLAVGAGETEHALHMQLALLDKH